MPSLPPVFYAYAVSVNNCRAGEHGAVTPRALYEIGRYAVVGCKLQVAILC